MPIREREKHSPTPSLETGAKEALASSANPHPSLSNKDRPRGGKEVQKLGLTRGRDVQLGFDSTPAYPKLFPRADLPARWEGISHHGHFK